MSNIVYISENDIKDNELLSMDVCLACIEEMFDLMHDDKYVMGGKNGNAHGSRMEIRNGVDSNIYLSMSAYLAGKYNKVAFKVHGPNRYIDGSKDETNHVIVLYDNANGIPLAIMNGSWITTMRTAAVSAYATQKLIDGQPREIGIVGPGRINTEYAKWIVNRFPSISKIKVKGRGVKSIEAFGNAVLNASDRTIEICIYDDIKDVILDSDVISVITGFEFKSVGDMPFIRENWVKKGALIICPSFIKFTDKFMQEGANLVVDNYKMYEEYAEELGRPVYNKLSNLGNAIVDLVSSGKIFKEKVYNIFDLEYGKNTLVGQLPTLFASGGMGTEDIAVACAVLEEAKKRNVGTILEY